MFITPQSDTTSLSESRNVHAQALSLCAISVIPDKHGHVCRKVRYPAVSADIAIPQHIRFPDAAAATGEDLPQGTVARMALT